MSSTEPAYGTQIYTPGFNRVARDTDALIAEAQTKPRPEKVSDAAPGEGRSIYIRGLGITNAKDDKPVLGTSGMGPCVAVAFYNPQTKTGALAHFDVNTDPKSIHTMMQNISKTGDPVEVHLSGGQEISRPLVGSILGAIAEYPNATVKSASIMTQEGTLNSLALDTRNGEVSTRFLPGQFDKGPDHAGLMARHAAEAHTTGPLRLEYMNGEKQNPVNPEPGPTQPGT